LCKELPGEFFLLAQQGTGLRLGGIAGQGAIFFFSHPYQLYAWTLEMSMGQKEKFP
jgi:hypothetical protein